MTFDVLSGIFLLCGGNLATDPIREELLFQLAEAEGQLMDAAFLCRDARRRMEAAHSAVESIRIQIQIHELTKAKVI